MALLVAAHVATGLWAGGHDDLLGALALPRDDALRLAVGGRSLEAVRDGAVWRLWTGVLLHGDALHLGVNVVAVHALGRLLEPLVGGLRLVGWFALGGVSGSVASQLAGVAQSDGASGGAFALLGAAIVVGWRLGDRLPAADRRLLGPILGAFLLVNLVISAVVPVIDVAGHVGGLVGGVVVAACSGLGAPARRERSLVAGFVAVSVGACALGLVRVLAG